MGTRNWPKRGPCCLYNTIRIESNTYVSFNALVKGLVLNQVSCQWTVNIIIEEPLPKLTKGIPLWRLLVHYTYSQSHLNVYLNQLLYTCPWYYMEFSNIPPRLWPARKTLSPWKPDSFSFFLASFTPWSSWGGFGVIKMKSVSNATHNLPGNVSWILRPKMSKSHIKFK